MNLKNKGFYFLSVFVLASCAIHDGPPSDFSAHPDDIRDAVPANEPLSRYGNMESYTVRGKTYHVMKSSQGFVQSGDASWYGTKFHGKKTSSGEPYNMFALTAASFPDSMEVSSVPPAPVDMLSPSACKP